MINMVVGADTTKDSMVIVDNLKFNVTFDETLERATFRFADIFNGADYTFLMLGFTKGVFTSFSIQALDLLLVTHQLIFLKCKPSTLL